MLTKYFHQTQVCILPFFYIERGGMGQRTLILLHPSPTDSRNTGAKLRGRHLDTTM